MSSPSIEIDMNILYCAEFGKRVVQVCKQEKIIFAEILREAARKYRSSGHCSYLLPEFLRVHPWQRQSIHWLTFPVLTLFLFVSALLYTLVLHFFHKPSLHSADQVAILFTNNFWPSTQDAVKMTRSDVAQPVQCSCKPGWKLYDRVASRNYCSII